MGMGLITIGQYTGFAKGLGCVGKRGFGEVEAAWKGIENLKASGRHRPEQGPLSPYWCPYGCGKWHIGHSWQMWDKRRAS